MVVPRFLGHPAAAGTNGVQPPFGGFGGSGLGVQLGGPGLVRFGTLFDHLRSQISQKVPKSGPKPVFDKLGTTF